MVVWHGGHFSADTVLVFDGLYVVGVNAQEKTKEACLKSLQIGALPYVVTTAAGWASMKKTRLWQQVLRSFLLSA